MLRDLVQPFLRATVSQEFTEVSITSIQPVRFGFFTLPSTIVPLLHRRMACIYKLFTPLASFSVLLDLVQPFLRAEVSLEFAKISIRQWFLLHYSL